MSISASTSRTLHQTLGDEAAEDVVNWMHQMEFNRAQTHDLVEVSLSRFSDRTGAQLAAFQRESEKFREDMRRESLEFRQAMREEMAAFRQEMAAFKQETRDEMAAFRQEMATFRQEMRKEMAAFKQEVRADIARLEVKIEQRHAELMRWSLVYWVGAVASIAALARILR